MFDDLYTWVLTRPTSDVEYRQSDDHLSNNDKDYRLFGDGYNDSFDNCTNIDWYCYVTNLKCYQYIEIYCDRIFFSMTDSSSDEFTFDLTMFSTEVTEEELFQSSLVQPDPPCDIIDFRKLVKIARMLKCEQWNTY